jgi:hypothetical protein
VQEGIDERQHASKELADALSDVERLKAQVRCLPLSLYICCCCCCFSPGLDFNR